MRYAFELLVRTRACADPAHVFWQAVCPVVALTGYAADDHSALSDATAGLRSWVDLHGVNYIRAQAMDESGVNCPKATIQWPSDIVHCKETKQICPTQGWLQLDSADPLQWCNAGDAVKAGVRGALRAGYSGLHHFSGTYLCGGCNAEDKFGYSMRSVRFPFELQNLSAVRDLSDSNVQFELRRKLIIAGRSTNVLYTGYCSRCIVEVVDAVSPREDERLHVVSLDYKTKY